MRENFQETIKQKTNKALETISKDNVFYSKEEQLIALNELEYRNSLSKELLLRKKDIESSIEIVPTVTEQALEAIKSEKKIYTESAIWVGIILGGPLVAGYLIAENFKAFNEISKAKKTWIYTILGTIVIFICAFFISDDVKISKRSIPLLYAIIAYIFTNHFQSRNISGFMELGGKPYGWWRTIVVSLIGLVITIVVIFFLSFIIL